MGSGPRARALSWDSAAPEPAPNALPARRRRRPSDVRRRGRHRRRARRDRRHPLWLRPLGAQARRRPRPDQQAIASGPMAATIIDGRTIAAPRARAGEGRRCGPLADRTRVRHPGWPRSSSVRTRPPRCTWPTKRKACAEAGDRPTSTVTSPATAGQDDVAAVIDECNGDPRRGQRDPCSQLPVPAGLDAGAAHRARSTPTRTSTD